MVPAAATRLLLPLSAVVLLQLVLVPSATAFLLPQPAATTTTHLGPATAPALRRAAPAAAAARAAVALRMKGAGAEESEGGDDMLPGLVTPAWLEAHLEDEDLAILDVRGEVAKAPVASDGSQATEYRALFGDYVDGHIPGAAFVDWTRDIAHTDAQGVPVQLLPLEALRTAFEGKGVGLRKRVVVYDGGNLLFATRTWWALRMAGHRAVAVLDGGWARWLAEDRPVTADAPCPLKINEPWESEAPARSVLGGGGAGDGGERPFLSDRVKADVVLRSYVEPLQAYLKENEKGDDGKRRPPVQIIDARSRDQYLGRVARSMRAGHIPGAVSVPYKELLGPEVVHPKTGLAYRRMKSPAELEATLRAAGVIVERPSELPEGQAPIATCCSCNGGVASTVVIFALNQLAGQRAVNYDGSANEWNNREDLPLERAAAEP